MSFFTGKKATTIRNDYGTLNPEQKALTQQLGPQLKSLTANPSFYSGNYTADMTPGEQDVLTQNSRLSALGEKGLSSALLGEFPEDYYQNSVYKPLLKQYKEDIQPSIEESYAGPNGSGYYGSARANAVSKGYRDVYDTLANKRAELAWNAQNNIPNAINAANSLSTTSAAIQAAPRLIKQYGLDKQYEEWTRGKAEQKAYIDQALDFLNISTVTDTYTPVKKSGFQMFTEGAGMGGPLADVMAGNDNWDSTYATGQTINRAGIAAMSGGMGGGGGGAASTTPGYSAGYQMSPAEMARVNKSAYYQ